MSRLRVSSFVFGRNPQCETDDHHPHQVYCPDPDMCCGDYGPISLLCCQDGERWPCATKQAHVAERRRQRVSEPPVLEDRRRNQ